MRPRVRITGLGRAVPEQVLTNTDLERMVETTDEWIVERTGIRERHIAVPGETTSTLGTAAARAALDSAGVSAEAIDLIVVGTSTPDAVFPATASRIQDALGARRAGAFDVNAACAGFLAAISTGMQFVAGGGAERVLVVGAETMSRIIDWTDRNTCVLFGDGAGAVVLERGTADEPGALESFVLRSDGSLASLLYCGGPNEPAIAGSPAGPYIVMDGRNVFRQAVTAMTQAAAEALARAGLGVSDIALCVPHQANLRIVDAVARNLGLRGDRVFTNLERYGNTSSASIPIALSEANDLGRLQPGDHLLMLAFGGGLAWGAMVVEWAGVRSARPRDASVHVPLEQAVPA
ncbi:MAG: ketoacyl-ACP synthase III [Dehalococcoidia bacterium]|nr:ketoacyl-ACP synthase III [Dehalococcoidia bacterium]